MALPEVEIDAGPATGGGPTAGPAGGLRRALSKAKAMLAMRMYISAREKADITDRFHILYYDLAQSTWKNTRWLGTPVNKLPLDLWLYQELLAELRPDLIVETGTLYGGSALYLAGICDLIGHGQVLSVDIAPRDQPAHPRVRYLTGSSTEPSIVRTVAEAAEGQSVVLVILDSDHTRDHVLDELHAYAPFVTPGSYLIVEDTNLNGHPVFPRFGPGPMEAVDEFLRHDRGFRRDPSMERLLLTFNPKGYLKRLA